ncbi:MAG TPA: SGNH/GDSL hydrolase family protein [Acidimicrobiia bacterium]|jgi:hypothetical protein|nr:SGNH/GDSL hydrolase family protein [Acidimicrobiia bacterium]
MKRSVLALAFLVISACAFADESDGSISSGISVEQSTPVTSLEAGETTSPVSESPSEEQPLLLVPIGISLATTQGCSDCTESLVNIFAEFVEIQLGRPVDIEYRFLNQTIHADQPIETEKLLNDLREWDAMREAISEADIVVVDIGYNDTPWNRFDDPCGVAPDFPIVNWSGLTRECMTEVAEDHRGFLDLVLAEIDALRAGKPTAVRVVTVYNSTIGNTVDASWDSPDAVEPTVYGNDLFVEIECEEASSHGAACADVYHVFNGSDGRAAAEDYLAPDYTHLNRVGHITVARILADIGLEQLQP